MNSLCLLFPASWPRVRMTSTPSSGIRSGTPSSSLCTRDTQPTSSQWRWSPRLHLDNMPERVSSSVNVCVCSSCLTPRTGSWSQEPPTPRCTCTTWRRRRPLTCSQTTPTASSASQRLPCGPTPSGARRRTALFGTETFSCASDVIQACWVIINSVECNIKINSPIASWEVWVQGKNFIIKINKWNCVIIVMIKSETVI